ncbi:MAG: hypothetical protein WBE76_29095 [Terracidiphilus sp.]
MLELVKLRVSAALAVVIVTSPPVLPQPHPLSLCIVDTKSHRLSQYDPSAGPYAIAMYQELAGRRLQSGAALHITVLPASMQEDILPEVHSLNCCWVLQLWYQRSTDDDVFGQAQPRGLPFDSLLFTLWNGTTRKVVERGTGLVSQGKPMLTPFAAFRKQILKKLNQLP